MQYNKIIAQLLIITIFCSFGAPFVSAQGSTGPSLVGERPSEQANTPQVPDDSDQSVPDNVSKKQPPTDVSAGGVLQVDPKTTKKPVEALSNTPETKAPEHEEQGPERTESDLYRDNSRDIVKSQHIEPDSFTGSLHYEYPIVTPPGRSGMSPDIRLAYSSQPSDQVGPYGYGWSDSIPYVERINKKGSDKLYTENFFYSSLDGELLANDTSPTTESYGAKVEGGDFRAYQYADNSKWIVTDKVGTKYTFGATAASRQDDPQNSAHVSKWMLEEVRDRNGNYVKYEYFKDAGQIYPSKITYTGNGTTDGIFEVSFSRETRPDINTSFRTAFGVTSTYRVKEIQVKINGVLTKKYVLGYTSSANGRRSLLQSVTETGYDEASAGVTLPATTFGYQLPPAGEGWSNQGVGSGLPEPVITEAFTDKGGRLMDANGDGLTDLVISRTGYSKVFLKTPTGWSEASWGPPATFRDNNLNRDGGVQFADVNGDGLVDIIDHPYASNIYNKTFINTGAGWVEDPAWATPYYAYALVDPSIPGDHGVRFADVNGDGLADILMSHLLGPGPALVSWINNGHGWTQDSTWNSPTPFANTEAGYDYGARLADVNGDGLTDILSSRRIGCYESTSDIYINNGNGWTLDPAWHIPPEAGFIGNSGAMSFDMGVRITDINGDGFPDIVHHEAISSCGTGIYLGTGAGWDFSPELSMYPPVVFTGYPTREDQGNRIADINGDGLEDIASGRDAYSGFVSILYSNKAKKVDLLSTITSSSGAVSSITYQASALYTATSTLLNPQLPQNYDTVKKIELNDGLGNIVTTNYSYEGGLYYYNGPDDRRPAGFHIVTKTDAAGNATKTFFHQGDTSDTSHGEYVDDPAKIGKPYRVEARDTSGNLYSTTVNKWEAEALANGRSFVALTQKTDLQYDGDSTHKDRAETYEYDTSTGNLTQKVSFGEVTAQADGSFTDIGADKYIQAISYAIPTGAMNVTGRPSVETLNDQSGQIVSKTRHYYDSLALGSVDKGNETKVEQLKAANSYITSEKSYNQFGLPISEIDPRGKITLYSYDTYNLYPVTVSRPLDLNTQYVYDYSLGKPKRMIDPNGFVFETVYDGLDRVVEEKQPDISSPTTLVTKATYLYTDTGIPRSVKKSTYLDGSNVVDSYSYTDGLSRPVQQRTETETSGTFTVRDFTYNNRGMLASESLPYFSSGSAVTSVNTTPALFSVYTYDAIGRPLSITNAVGITTNTYSDWKTTVTDPRGKTKDLFTDAYGNVIKVQEHNDGATYTTQYEYNGLQNLTKITDALGNIRNFTYDKLGRRLTAEDLHAPGDTTFGVNTYVYDDAGNLIQLVDAKNQTVNYTYDDINRELDEDFTATTGRDAVYQYDTCTKGKGRLCYAGTTDAVTTYQYDALGNPTSETVAIGTLSYTTGFVHDRQGNLTYIVYPDNAQVKYTYNNAGAIETVSRKESTDLSYTPVVSNFDYGPTGQITAINFANSVTTANTYDAAALYRLSDKTTSFGGTYLQKNNYTYDANGNITRIVDTSNTLTAKTTDFGYDDLNRLISAAATNVASTTSAYTQAFVYNALGNILSGPAGTYTYAGDTGSSYANPHAVTTISGGSGGGSANGTYVYDRNGNLTSDGTFTHTWNYRNQLIASQNGTSTPSTSGYDHQGLRIKLSETGGPMTYYPNKLYTTAGNQATSTKHIFAGDLLVATVETPPTIAIAGGGEDSFSSGEGGGWGSLQSLIDPIEEDPPSNPVIVHYVHTDHLTGSNVITNQNGTVAETLDYYPYGQAQLDVTASNYAGEKRKYAGHEYDAGTGLTYMNARFQDGKRGQFLSQDPSARDINPQTQKQQIFLANPQRANMYSYAIGNPLRYNDPNGESAWDRVNGFANAVFSNNALGSGRVPGNLYNGNRADYQSGQSAGDIFSMIQAVAEIVGGSTLAGGGAILMVGSGGLAVAVSVPAAAGGAAAVTHGVSVAGLSAYNFSRSESLGPEYQGGNYKGVDFSDHAVRQMNERKISADQVINTIESGEKFDYYHESTWKTGYFDSKSKIFVGQVKDSGKTTTVIRNVKQNYINNLKAAKPPK